MKTLTIILILLIGTKALAQPDSTEKKAAQATVTLLSQDHELVREIYETEDSSILLRIPVASDKKDSLTVYSNLSVPVDRIQSITLREKSVGKGLRNGALIGFGVGALFGFFASVGDAQEGDWIYISPGEMALSAGILCTLPGMIIGAAIGGFSKVVIPINGSQENYKRNRGRLADYSVQKK